MHYRIIIIDLLLLVSCSFGGIEISNEFQVHEKSINRFVESNNRLLSVGNDGKVFSSDFNLTKYELVLDSGYETIKDIVRLDGNRFFISSFDQGFTIFNLKTSESLHVDFSGIIDSIAYWKTGNTIIFSSFGKLYSYDLNENRIYVLSETLAIGIESMLLINDNELALGTFSGYLLIYDLTNKTVTQKFDLKSTISSKYLLLDHDNIYIAGQANGTKPVYTLVVNYKSGKIQELSLCDETAFDLKIIKNKLYIACGDLYILSYEEFFRSTQKINVPNNSANALIYVKPYLYFNGGKSTSYIGGSIYRIKIE